MFPDEQQIVAIHEAGHAVIAQLIGHLVIRASLTDGVRTRYRCGGRDAHWRQALICLAGPAAECRCCATPLPAPLLAATQWRDEWHGDLHSLRYHLAACGADPRRCRDVATLAVRNNWASIMRVAAALYQRGTLTGDEVAMLVGDSSPPEERGRITTTLRCRPNQTRNRLVFYGLFQTA